jgi:phage baseplate assembly protein W
MPQYIGYSTINSNKPRTTDMPTGSSGGPGNLRNPIIPGKKVKLVDEQLVIQDFINALNIPQGSKVGQPAYGTTLWSFVFEQNTIDVQNQLENEIRRVASLDPRLILNTVNGYPQENGILIEIELAIAPYNNPTILSVYFDNLTNTAAVR